MKKKLLVIILSLCSVFACALGLTACGGTRNTNDNDSSCSHSYEYILIDESQHLCVCAKCGDSTAQSHTFNKNNVCSKCGAIKNTDPSGNESNDNPTTQNKKTISLNPNGGKLNNSGEIQTKDFEVGKVMSALPTPIRDGYTFVCWEDAFGVEYTAATVMPNSSLQLKARWEKNITGYSDDYVSFKPASEGYKNSEIYNAYRRDVDKFVYVELTSDDLGGVDRVGVENNFNLRTLEGMEYKVKSGYTWLWYQGSFNTPNGAQRFTLRYGSNIQFVTISNSSGVVQQTYLLDIYVKHDYYINLYSNIFETEPYDRVRVIEKERFSAKTEAKEEKGFEFDKRVYYNSQTLKYEDFVYTTAITKNWNLYQAYKPITIPAELDEGTLSDSLIITPYTQYFTLPSAEKEGYDFLGWQDESGEYITNVMGYSGENYISKDYNPKKLTAVYAEKKYYYTFENDTLNTYKTVPVVTYTDKTMHTILEILYVPYNTDCVLPVKTAQGDNEIFVGWQYYYLSDKNEFSHNLSTFDFDRKITTPLALVPQTETANRRVPLNGELTSRDTGTYKMYLPANERYQLTISTTNSVSITINKYGATNNSKTLTVKSSAPTTVNLDYYVYNLGNTIYSHGYVTFEVTSLSGSFTAKLVGSTASTSGSPINTNDNNTAKVGEEFTVSLVKSGYAFAGWFEGDKKISDNEFITMQDREMEVTAKWVICPVTLEKNIAEAGTVSGISGTTVIGKEATITAVTKSGYTWLGWYNGDTLLTKELSYTFVMPSINTTYTAKWIKVSVARNNTSAGSVTSLSGTYLVGDNATITASTNSGYTWVGWYNGDSELTKELSYTFEMPSESATYMAKWSKITLARSNTSAGTVSSLTGKYTVGQEVTVTANTYSGYTFLGWYNDEVELSKESSYTFEMPSENATYTAKWTYYTLTTDRNNSSAGTVTTKNAVKTTAGQEVTIVATTNSGYTFEGWYNGDTLLSTNANYTFEMPAESVTYTAKWTSYTLTTARNDNSAGTVTTKNAVKTTAGQEVTIVATTNSGYTFEGWYNGDTLLSTNANYTFEMPAESVTYIAKWTSYTLTVVNTIGGSVSSSGKNQATITFNLNGASGTAPVSQIITKTSELQYPTIPTRSGYVFAGWYVNATCTGTPFDFSATINEDMVLYAKWISYSGAGIITVNSNKSVSVVKKDSTSKSLYAFVPLVDGTITVYTTGSLDTYGYLFDSAKSQLTYDDDGGDGNNFKITYTVTAGTLYYVSPCGYSSTGNTTLYLTGELPQAGGKLTGDVSYTEPQKVTAGNSVTLKAVTEDGYTFVGWFDGENELSRVLEYAYNMPAENKVITAKWMICPVSVINSDSIAGQIQFPLTTIIGEEVTLRAIPNNGYTFVGWFNGDILLTRSFTYSIEILNENITCTAKWIVCPVTFEKNIAEAGQIQGMPSSTSVGDNIQISAVTNRGYTWLGWYNGDVLLSEDTEFAFTMSLESIVYTAKWACYTLTTQSNMTDAGNYTIKQAEKIKAGDNITLAASTSAGYTWLGWYNGEILLSEDTEFTFTMPSESIVYTAKWACYTLTTQSNMADAGNYTIKLATKTTVGTAVTLTAVTNGGYTWLGWYNGDKLLTNDLTLRFTMPAENLSYTAMWTYYTVTTNTNINGAGNYTNKFNTKTTVGELVALIADTNIGYTFLGWYDEETLLTNERKYEFTMSTDDVTYIAKYKIKEEMEYFNFVSTTTTCKINSIIDTTVKEIVVPDYVTQIEKGAFYGCKSLMSISIPFVGGDANAVTASPTTLFGYIFGTDRFEGSMETKQYYGSYNSNLYATYFIPATLVRVNLTGGQILYGAFYNCASLISLSIPETTTSIGDYASYGCYKLVEIYNFSALNITAGSSSGYNGSIASYAKDVYTSINEESKLSIKDSKYIYYTDVNNVVWFIGYVGSESELVLPDYFSGSSYNVYRYAFYNSELTSIMIGKGVGSLTYEAFMGCVNVEIIEVDSENASYYSAGNCIISTSAKTLVVGCKNSTIPSGGEVIKIGDYAFSACSGLRSISIPYGVTTIGSYAFRDCIGITSITIASSVTSIGTGAFYRCNSLVSITIPSNMTEIDSYLFYECSKLKSVSMGSKVTRISYHAFYGCSSLTDISIPSSVTSIGEYAFANCSSLTSITLPSNGGFSQIYRYTFSGCTKLKSITIPKAVSGIAIGAFENCTSLTSATFMTTKWKIYTHSVSMSTTLSVTDLQNTSTAAKFLRSTYASNNWIIYT